MEKTPDNWVEILKREYENGASDIEVCKAINMTKATFNKNMESSPNFRKLVEYGRTLSEAWWMGHARTALFNRAMNTNMWAMVMRNRFGWTDKSQEVADVPNNQRSVEEAREQLAKLVPKLVKEFAPELKESDLVKNG